VSTCHHLKIHPEPFRAVREGRKTAEFRDTSDRDFQVGDALILQEYIPSNGSWTHGDCQCYTGEVERVFITDITGIPEGYAMLSFHRTTTCPQTSESE
jgi:hypothetical protein